jgi:hypothetical protein
MMVYSVEHITTDELLNERRQRNGLIPVFIDSEQQTLKWMDMGMYHFYEGFFRKSLDIYTLLKKDIVSFTTDLAILEDDRVAENFVYPSGFIFHAGHCRSTALSKSLARSRTNLLLSEATPLSQILFSIQGSIITDKNKQIYRNLVLAMCRQRVNSHTNAFIKFTSHNIHFFDLIHTAFPDVPAIFLTRDSEEITASFHKHPPRWLTDKDDLEAKVKGFLAKADSIPHDQLLPMNHLMVTSENLPNILGYFKTHTNQQELHLMMSQFSYDSKTEFNRKLFAK